MNELVIANNQITLKDEFLAKYRDFKKLQLEIDLMEKEINQEVKRLIEEENLDYKNTIGFKINYKKPSERTTIDSTRLKAECPDIYEAYSKTSQVSSSAKIEIL